MAEPIFQRSLQDLVKGIRSHKKDASQFISQQIAEIKIELRSTDPFLKAEAVRKLTYLQMLGYNVSWASFAIVEVMSQPRFGHKRVGYLAANQSFNDATDVLLLTTNLFKKEFASSQANQYEIGLAINSLANIASKDLARDCMSDLVSLMNHTRPYVRKKSVLAMFKLYVQFPQGLRLTFDRLKERLDDSESSVISTAVNVICELANKNPRNYLAMAPKFFRLLTTSSNNWMLIKVVKLLGALVGEEPRLARKLLEPLATIIQNTGAKSLQYECIQTITEALPHTRREDGTDAKSAPAVVKLCSDYLRGFIEDNDQNLKYLGLVGLVSLMRSHPRSVVEHRELVLRCLSDDDVTIRTRALELLAGIVSRKSLVDLVHHLLEHVKQSEGTYRDEIIAKVLYMCSKEKYALVTDFAWYTSILLDLAVMQGSQHGKEVADQLIEISLRVDTVRPYAVEAMLSMLLNDSLILGQARVTVSAVLKAAAWVIGEYSEIISAISSDHAADDEEGDDAFWIEGPTGEDIRSVWRGQKVHLLVLSALLHPRATNLPTEAQCAYVQSAMKIFLRACSDCTEEDIAAMVGVIRARLGVFLQSTSVEVQERASTFRHLIAELNILSVNWKLDLDAAKAAAEEVEDASNKPKDDLLDISTAMQAGLTAELIDSEGAKNALKKKRVLQAVIGESFYAVHAKAQKRVPVPEGLDLDKPFSSSNLTKLLNTEIPENVNLTSLYFTQVPTFTPANAGFNSQLDEEEDARIKKLAQNTWGDSEEKKSDAPATYNAFAGDSGSMAAGTATRPAEDAMFYLNNETKKTDGVVPLSQLLADTFEDKKGKKGKKDKRDKKARRLPEQEIDTRELLPAGAASYDSDEELAKKAAKKVSKKVSRRSEDADLSNVDLSAPLGGDEALPTLKHREVPVKSPPKPSQAEGNSDALAKALAEDDDQPTNGAKKKGKKDKKDKKEKKPKAGKSNGAASASLIDDLLGLDLGGDAMASMAAPMATPAIESVVPTPAPTPMELDGIMVHSDTNGGKEKKHKSKDKDKSEKKSKKSSSSSAFWMACCNDRNASVYYAPSVSGSTMTIALRAENVSANGCVISVEAGVTSVSNGAFRPSQPSVTIARDISVGADAKGAVDLTFDGNPITETLMVGLGIRVSAEGLLGPETSTVTAAISISPCVFNTPHGVDEDGFAGLVGKSSSRWASQKTSIPLQGSKKSAIKSLAAVMNAHVVEAEATKAASLCAKAPNNSIICALVKFGKDGSSVSVDVKCLGPSKTESQQAVDAVTQALQTISL